MPRPGADKIVFLNRSKASRVEVLEYASTLERTDQVTELLLLIRDAEGNYSFIGATDEILQDPARVIGQLEMLKQVILGQSFS
ncbi:MAG TPA: hypothetical protein VNT75_06635 [Symbiobacteriaceae bacterium]|nr:hypothetical protein [Symbiobacteriaceae bacterium]